MGKKILLITLLSSVIIKTFPQSFISNLMWDKNGRSKQFAAIPVNQSIKFDATKLSKLLALNDGSSLVLMHTMQEKSGFIHYHYYQTYKGVPVENSMYIIHTKNGLIESLGGFIVTNFDSLAVTHLSAKISGEQSINTAIKFVNAKMYAWQNNEMEQNIQQQTGKSYASYKPSARLVWYCANEAISTAMRLCYKIDVYALMPLSRAYYYVDAITGKVIGKQDELFYADTTGTAVTAYSRIQTIHSDYYNGTCRLRDYSKGGGILTFHGEPGKIGTDYTNASPNWNLNTTDQASLDVQYGIAQTYLFYKTIFNRNSYDDKGATITSYVNIPAEDVSYWDGSAVNFGKRSSGMNGGMSGIDIVAHELTHGVTQQTSGLIYSKESGAINESLSDIFGKSIQFWTKPNDVDWRLGNEMNFVLRDMSNPKAYHQPDTYKGINWATDNYDNYGVHTNCGVGNFMFYLLVNGGTGTNDNGDNYSVTGIGITEADAILYRSNNIYLTPTSQYTDWRTACINAATDIYGAASNEVTQVENAWYAAGIGTSGYSTACDTPTNLIASSVTTSAATISWNIIPGAASYTLKYKTFAAIAYTTVTGITSSSYNLTGLTAGTAYTYQVQTVCSDTSSGNYSGINTFTTSGTAPAFYCTTSGNSTYEYINKVVLGSISNTSGNNNGYSDYTSLTTTLNAGTSKTITLIPGFTGAAYKEYWTVYIDYDKNKIFDSSEEVTKGNGMGTVIRTFTIPAMVKSGYTRMRIIMHYNSARANTCDTFADGEVEDYRIHINNNASTSNIVTASVNAALPANMIVTPNPATGNNIKIVLQSTAAAPVTLCITDLSGRMLLINSVHNALAGKNVYSINYMHLKPGTYIIVAAQHNSVIARTKFIVAE